MTNEEAISLLRQVKEAILNSNSWDETTNEPITDSFDMAIKALEDRRWIPVKWHTITEEEREREEYPNDWVVFIDSLLPENGEEILITTKNGYVEKDTAYCDAGNYLDSGYDWIEDVVAWMPLPKPYEGSKDGRE